MLHIVNKHEKQNKKKLIRKESHIFAIQNRPNTERNRQKLNQ